MAKPGLRINTDPMRAIIEQYGEGAVDDLEVQGMLRLGNTLEARAVELAPFDTGELESSTNLKIDRRGTRIRALLTFDAPHAADAHEWKGGRGERTTRKPGNQFGPAGPKYLERPLRGFQLLMGRDLARSLNTIWNTKRAGKSRRRRRG
jgi:hypothetical protein